MGITFHVAKCRDWVMMSVTNATEWVTGHETALKTEIGTTVTEDHVPDLIHAHDPGAGHVIGAVAVADQETEEGGAVPGIVVEGLTAAPTVDHIPLIANASVPVPDLSNGSHVRVHAPDLGMAVQRDQGPQPL
jgi:hypothetical protein